MKPGALDRNLSRLACAGLGGMVGALLGWTLGYLGAPLVRWFYPPGEAGSGHSLDGIGEWFLFLMVSVLLCGIAGVVVGLKLDTRAAAETGGGGK